MKCFRLAIFCVVALLFTSFNLIAQSDSVMQFSLAEAQNYAVENYFITKNAALDIESSEKQVWETTAIGLPQISAEGSYQHIPGTIPELEFGLESHFNYIYENLPAGPPPGMDTTSGGSNPIAPRNSTNYSLTVSQLIFSGEYIVGLQAAKVYKTYSMENYEKLKIDIKESIAGTYYTILILQTNRSVLEKTLNNLQLNLEHTQKSYDVGLIEETDVDQLSLTVKRTENDLTSVDNQIETMKRMLKYQMGITSGTDVILTETLDGLVAINIIADSDYTFDLEGNIEYKLLETQEALQNLSWNREKSLYLPTLSAFYNYTDKTNKPAIDFTINHMIGVSANWTIFTSGMRSAKIAQERIALEQATNMKLQESERLVLVAEQSKYDYQTALRKYYNERENFALSERVFNKATEQYKEGFISSLELSIINNQFLGAQLTYSTSLQELLDAKVKLDKAHNRL